MDYLSTDSMNVCLNMELSLSCNLGHSTNTCKPALNLINIMRETSTEIVVSSCESTREMAEEVSNHCHRVLIKGPLAKVERARQEIRAANPVEFVISCRADKVDLLGKRLLFAHFSTLFCVTISFVLIAEDDSYQVSLRSSRKKMGLLKEAASHFCDICQIPLESSVEAQFSISNNHAMVLQNQARLIERFTGVMLRISPSDNSMAFVRGSIDTICRAADIIEGLAPVYLHFSVPNSININRIRAIARAMDVIMSTQPEEDHTHLLLYTYEWNARLLYELWRLTLSSGAPVIPSHPESWMNFRDSGLFFGNLVEEPTWTCRCALLGEEVSVEDRSNCKVIRSPENSPPPRRPSDCRTRGSSLQDDKSTSMSPPQLDSTDECVPPFLLSEDSLPLSPDEGTAPLSPDECPPPLSQNEGPAPLSPDEGPPPLSPDEGPPPLYSLTPSPFDQNEDEDDWDPPEIEKIGPEPLSPSSLPSSPLMYENPPSLAMELKSSALNTRLPSDAFCGPLTPPVLVKSIEGFGSTERLGPISLFPDRLQEMIPSSKMFHALPQGEYAGLETEFQSAGSTSLHAF